MYRWARSREGKVEEFLALSDEQQEALLKRLTHHALCRMRGLTWRGARLTKGGTVPSGYEPYDFALDAVRKLLDGTRPWNKTAHDTIEKSLLATIDSDISHLVNRLDNRRVRRVMPTTTADEQDFDFSGREPDPVDVVIDTDWQAEYQAAVLKELGEDEFLAKLFECLRAEITEPTEIAELFGVSPEDINNAKKRLRRKVEKLDGRVKPTNKKVRP